MPDPLMPEEISYIANSYWDRDEIRWSYPAWVTHSLERKGFLKQDPFFTRKKGMNFLAEMWKDGDRQFADRISSFLGSGLFGAAYLLTDGSVLKLTWDEDWEMGCVRYLLDNKITNPHLPIIYEYGHFAHDPDLYYYIREPLDDLPNLSRWVWDFTGWDQELIRMSVPLEEKYGINIRVDARPQNFGIRPGQPDVFVLRDVACDYPD